jgi:hypothetical protein
MKEDKIDEEHKLNVSRFDANQPDNDKQLPTII